ncbi:MAG: hypothetical protein GX490_04865 [Bacilli bacterium]|nr:hypothetical protein [Bacilli bacterium]
MCVLYIIIGSFMILLGLFVWKYKFIELIANANEITNRSAYAKYLGINCLIMGSLVIIYALVNLYVYQLEEALSVFGFTVIICLCFGINYIVGKKFRKE